MKTFEVFVAFDDADPAGIVFFGNYFRIAHRALERFFAESSLGWEGWFRRSGVGIPLRHVEADYLSIIRPGKSVWVGVGVDKIGTTSVTFKYEFRSSNDSKSELLATLKTVHVFIDVKDKKKIPVPEDLLKFLKS